MVWDICMIHGVFIPLLNDLRRTSILCGWSATGPICSKACFLKNRMMMTFFQQVGLFLKFLNLNGEFGCFVTVKLVLWSILVVLLQTTLKHLFIILCL